MFTATFFTALRALVKKMMQRNTAMLAFSENMMYKTRCYTGEICEKYWDIIIDEIVLILCHTVIICHTLKLRLNGCLGKASLFIWLILTGRMMCSMFYCLQDRLVVDGDQVVAELHNLFRLLSFYQGYRFLHCLHKAACTQQ